MMEPRHTSLLAVGGALSSAVALLHFVIIFVGAPAYRYFGAGERMARQAERGAIFPAVITLALTLIFALWAAYAFSGAGFIPRLPLLRTALVTIGFVYTLRGLALIPQVWFLVQSGGDILPRHLFFSAVFLLIGLAYLLGTQQVWRHLDPPGV